MDNRNFNLEMENRDIISKFGSGCDGVFKNCGVGDQVDDGRFRPCEKCCIGFGYDFDVWMLDDGRLVPPRLCDVYFCVMDGRQWVFHDGG